MSLQPATAEIEMKYKIFLTTGHLMTVSQDGIKEDLTAVLAAVYEGGIRWHKAFWLR